MTKNRAIKQAIRAYMEMHKTSYATAYQMLANPGSQELSPSIIWNPKTFGQTLLVCSQEEARTLYSTVDAMVQEAPEEFEWFGIDLQLSMFESRSAAYKDHLSRSLYEAWKLSVDLEREVTKRQQGEPGKRLLVMIERGDFLAEVLTDEENRDEQMFEMIMPNLRKVIEEGRKVNVHVLMRVKEENVESWKNVGFTHVLTP